LLKRIALLSCLIATPALAQQTDPVALGNVLLACVGREVQAASRIVQLEAEVAKLKAAQPPAATGTGQ
jgi:hypothetical protein